MLRGRIVNRVERMSEVMVVLVADDFEQVAHLPLMEKVMSHGRDDTTGSAMPRADSRPVDLQPEIEDFLQHARSTS